MGKAGLEPGVESKARSLLPPYQLSPSSRARRINAIPFF